MPRWPSVATALLFAAGLARADAQQQVPETNEVVVEGARPEEEQRVRAFVSNITRRGYGKESLVRWRQPVCPLVAGLAGQQGEYILYALTQAARAAGAPLGAEKCQPNLHIVVASEPEQLVERWSKRTRGLFGDASPMTVRNFLQDSPKPVRVWYNTGLICGAGAGSPRLERGPSGLSLQESSTGCQIKDTRLQTNYVDAFASVIVMVDADLIKDIKLGQLADYVAMVGLAKMDVDASFGDAPTILRLFADSTVAPPTMSPWDRSFLEALYHTPQQSRIQRATIGQRVMRDVTSQ